MDRKAQDELKIIQDAIIAEVDPRIIYLFGSYAYGTPNKDSDFDIYVVLNDDSVRPLLAMQRINMLLSKQHIRPVDILANTTEKFAQRQKLPTIERTVAESGVKLYERRQHRQAMA